MITTEVKKQVILAVPLIVDNGQQFILLMLIDHLRDQLALSGASTTTSFASVTAFSLLVWMTFLPSSLLFAYILCYNIEIYCYCLDNKYLKKRGKRM